MTINVQNKQNILEAVEIVTKTPVTTVIIWLHGLGADGHDFVDMVPQLKIPEKYGVRFIFPHAPVRPVTINQGMRMRAWYDITTLTEIKDDIVGISESCNAIQALIHQEIAKGIPASNIFVAGFSQGGAIALHAALRFPQILGGVIGLSTYLPASHEIPAVNFKGVSQLPIILLHGDYDEIIPCKIGEMSRDVLRQLGYQVEWKQYPMAHQVCMPEISDISVWLMNRI